jgi:hypothetical protein
LGFLKRENARKEEREKARKRIKEKSRILKSAFRALSRLQKNVTIQYCIPQRHKEHKE